MFTHDYLYEPLDDPYAPPNSDLAINYRSKKIRPLSPDEVALLEPDVTRPLNSSIVPSPLEDKSQPKVGVDLKSAKQERIGLPVSTSWFLTLFYARLIAKDFQSMNEQQQRQLVTNLVDGSFNSVLELVTKLHAQVEHALKPGVKVFTDKQIARLSCKLCSTPYDKSLLKLCFAKHGELWRLANIGKLVYDLFQVAEYLNSCMLGTAQSLANMELTMWDIEAMCDWLSGNDVHLVWVVEHGQAAMMLKQNYQPVIKRLQEDDEHGKMLRALIEYYRQRIES